MPRCPSTSVGVLVFLPKLVEESPAIQLYGVKKGDIGCAIDKDTLKSGDVIECCGKRYVVTGGERADKVYGGRHFIVMETVFDFNSHKVRDQVCPPVIIKAKQAWLSPKVSLESV